VLNHFFPSLLARGLAECVIAVLVSLVVVLLVKRRGVNLLGELSLAELRGIAQIVLCGVVLQWMLHGPQWTSVPVLAGMMLTAASIVRSRAKSIPRVYTLALISIFCGAGGIIAVMTMAGVIELKVAMLVPVGSMLIAQTMNMQSLFLDRLKGEVTSHIGEIESALALAASPSVAVENCPSSDNLRHMAA
jgi:putative ABC transport system permease protein